MCTGSSDPTLARPGNSCGETAGSRVVDSSDEVDDVDWTGGGHSWSREVGRMDWHQERMAQLELRDESLRWVRQVVVKVRDEWVRDECRDQHGRGDQCGGVP